jgi:hypothetical protein
MKGYATKYFIDYKGEKKEKGQLVEKFKQPLESLEGIFSQSTRLCFEFSTCFNYVCKCVSVRADFLVLIFVVVVVVVETEALHLLKFLNG